MYALIGYAGDMNMGFAHNDQIRERMDARIAREGLTGIVETRETGKPDTRGNMTYELAMTERALK